SPRRSGSPHRGEQSRLRSTLCRVQDLVRLFRAGGERRDETPEADSARGERRERIVSQWQDRDFVGKITQILEGVAQPDSASSGRTFVTVYQLAIMFANQYREDAEAVHKEVGGKTSIGNSLSA